MSKKQIRVFLETEDIQTLTNLAGEKDKSLSEICRDILREKIISTGTDEFSSKFLIEKRMEQMLKNFEHRLKQTANKYIRVPANLPRDLLIKTTIYGRANWEVHKKQLTGDQQETIYKRALGSLKGVGKEEKPEPEHKFDMKLGRKK